MSRRDAKAARPRATDASPEPSDDLLLEPADEAVDASWDRTWVVVWAGILIVICFIGIYNAVDALP